MKNFFISMLDKRLNSLKHQHENDTKFISGSQMKLQNKNNISIDFQVDFAGPMARNDETIKRSLKSSIYEKVRIAFLSFSSRKLNCFFFLTTKKELKGCPHTSSRIILSLILRKNSWDDISDNKFDGALTRLSELFSVPKVGITFGFC